MDALLIKMRLNSEEWLAMELANDACCSVSLVNWARKNKACFNTTQYRINHLEYISHLKDGKLHPGVYITKDAKFLSNNAIKRSNNP